MSFGPKNAAEGLVFAEENLLVDFQHAIHKLLAASTMTQRQLAARVDMSEAQMSNLFSGRANPTLKTMARLFHALGDECVITSKRLEKMGGRERASIVWHPIEMNSESTGAIQHPAAPPAVLAATIEAGIEFTSTVPELGDLDLNFPSAA